MLKEAAQKHSLTLTHFYCSLFTSFGDTCHCDDANLADSKISLVFFFHCCCLFFLKDDACEDNGDHKFVKNEGKKKQKQKRT